MVSCHLDDHKTFGSGQVSEESSCFTVAAVYDRRQSSNLRDRRRSQTAATVETGPRPNWAFIFRFVLLRAFFSDLLSKAADEEFAFVSRGYFFVGFYFTLRQR